MKEFKVYLVGAGPGDPELITVKAKRLVESADYILFDSLANEKILEYRKPTAELINVGKRAGNHLLLLWLLRRSLCNAELTTKST